MAITATVTAARILGRDCMVTLFVTQAEIDGVSRLVCDVMGVQADKVRYSPPNATRDTPTFHWNEDGDGKQVYVTVHVLPATANDNRIKEG